MTTLPMDVIGQLRDVDTEQAAVARRQQRRPFAEIQAARAQLACFLLDRADEARELLSVL